MTCFAKLTHLEQTLFVHSHQFFFSLKRFLGLFLWRKGRNITLWNATLFGNLQIDFHLEDKKKIKKKSIVSMLLSVLKINLASFLQEEALSDNVMRNNMLINSGY